MKLWKNSIGAVGIALVLVGCGQSGQQNESVSNANPSTPATRETAPSTPEELAKSTNTPSEVTTNAARETANLQAAQTKEEFVSSSEQKLSELDKRIGAYAKKTETLKADAKTTAEAALQTLRDKRAEANHKLADLKKASEQDWTKIKGDLIAALQNLENEVKKVAG